MNFQTEFQKGQEGGNKGIYLGLGLDAISKAINGVQKARIYGVGAAPKAGKSTFVDYGFLLGPYLESLKTKQRIEWIYFSFEIDRVSKEFDFVTFFLYHDYKISQIRLPKGITVKGESIIDLSPDYLRGRTQDDRGETIKCEPHLVEKVKDIYIRRIIPLFGLYDEKGKKVLRTPDGKTVPRGLIDFIEHKDNPTGLRKYLMNKAMKEGQFLNEGGKTNNRITGYSYNTQQDADKLTIIITDHLRKLVLERGFKMKETVDKMIEYQVELRNWCQYTFVDIIHLNRSMTDGNRLKQFGDFLYPNSDDIKDTGNLAEDADYVFTIFNPNDQRYNLTKHFGQDIRNSKGEQLYPYLRTVHLVESRHCYFPQHFKTNMRGNLKSFEPIELDKK